MFDFNLPKTEWIKIRNSILPHKIILKVNISHFALIPIVLSFFHNFFFNIWKDKSKEEKSRSDFIQHLFFPMLRCKTWVCNVDISYLKITVLIEESHFFYVGAKKSTTGHKAMAWNHNKWSEWNTFLKGRADTEHP